MNRFVVITVFPELIENALRWGVVGQAQKIELIQVESCNPRAFTKDIHQSVDDRPYGGSDGMLLMAEPLGEAIEKYRTQQPGVKIIYPSARGKILDDSKIRSLAAEKEIIFLCGRYAGIDQRLIAHYQIEEISLGDYVLSGGELAACVMIDAISRHVPKVLGHSRSADLESFSNGLLEAPQFTRPREIWDLRVPEVLIGGHHQKIEKWSELASWITTIAVRPDLAIGKVRAIGGDEASRILKRLESFIGELSEGEWQSFGIQPISRNELQSFFYQARNSGGLVAETMRRDCENDKI